MPGKVRPIHIPVSTYRLQLNRYFTFADLDRIVDYLNCIGITDIYLSPILKAKSGSPHGYDVTDPGAINPELGTEEDLGAIAQHLKQCGMGMIVDFVPNHMCISDPENVWWRDVLENGPSSPFAQFFDIDWNPPRENLTNKVLLPILDRQYGKALEEQKIVISYSAGSFQLVLDGVVLPVNPRTWPLILQPALESLVAELGESNADVMEFASILTALHYLPSRAETDQERVRERQREKEVVKRRLADLESKNVAVHDAILAAVTRINGIAGDPSSFDALDALLDSQPYRLSFWRVASEEINYRRFFDINDLAAIRVEDPEVFEHVHRKIVELIGKGWVTGIRVDHADGLFDPVLYFRDLRAACSIHADTPDRAFYVIAEKILTGDERLARDWQIHGTTGYEYLNLLNGLFVSRRSGKILRSFFARITGTSYDFRRVVYDAKKLILSSSMSSELHVLSRRLDRICQKQRHSRDFTLENLRFALGEVIACFPVYRTYTRMDQMCLTPEDLRHTLSAIQGAKARNPAFSQEVFDFIASVLLLHDSGLAESEKLERRMFVMRFQQLTGPVMAKGLEDTAFYRSFPLASLNEVGGGPELFGTSVRSFHEKNRERALNWPYSLLATSTHDTKWGEDARARLNTLSEIPLRWIRAVRRWQTLNKGHKVMVDGAKAPDDADEYRLYQALIAAWPPEGNREFTKRIDAYMQKAAKEAKLHTSWIQPNRAYEEALARFVARVLEPSPENQFLAQFQSFFNEIVQAGMLNSLSQTLLKIVSPGVPDFYQGCELWNFSLVDPDNRKPVDFSKGARIITELDAAASEDRERLVTALASSLHDGRAKLWLVSRGLRFRMKHPELFSLGAYIPIRAVGERRGNVIAFARMHRAQAVIAVAGRFFMGLLPLGRSLWEGSELIMPKILGEGTYRDVITGRTVQTHIRNERSHLALASVFSGFPAALLERI